MDEKTNYSAMTVNERLVVAGLQGAFDAAAIQKNRDRMIELLASVDVKNPASTVDTILADPARYGF